MVNILIIWCIIGGIILLTTVWTVFGRAGIITDWKLKDFVEMAVISIIVCMAAGVLWPLLIPEMIKIYKD